ncbi:MAG: DUF4405 domain-containing protein [Bacteroidales bacterium]|nr:DUF4405 domain-containing protein [Bacteroidales bacterium]
MKNKTSINFIIDAIMFVDMMAIAGIGFLIKYTLVPGYKENEIYGRNVDLTFWGMDRHEWGKVHLAFSLSFLFLLILHIVFHWNTIICMFKRLIRDKNRRTIIVPVFIVVSFILILFAFLIKPDIGTDFTGSNQMYGREIINPLSSNTDRVDDLTAAGETGSIHEDHPARAGSRSGVESGLGPGAGKGSGSGLGQGSGTGLVPGSELQPGAGNGSASESELKAELQTEPEHVHSDEHVVNGSMTLREVSNLHDVPPSFILSELGIPENTPEYTQLGQLRRRHGFTMSDVERIIVLYKENQ